MLSVKKIPVALLSVVIIAVITIWRQAATNAGKTGPVFSMEKVAADTLKWPKPRFSERKKDRHRMVKQSIKQQGINDKKVLEAMRQVPRHLFVPESQRNYAYFNRPLPIGHGQTISQPYIVAYMTQLLDLKAGERVLEIGTGSGYQAAVLSEITPYVFTIEIIEELGKLARVRFEKLGYTTIKTKIGDGYQGWEKYAPFDAILLTAAAEQIPKPLARQLKPRGTLIMPVGGTNEVQILVEVTKTAGGELKTERKLPVRFVPMTGTILEKN